MDGRSAFLFHAVLRAGTSTSGLAAPELRHDHRLDFYLSTVGGILPSRASGAPMLARLIYYSEQQAIYKIHHWNSHTCGRRVAQDARGNANFIGKIFVPVWKFFSPEPLRFLGYWRLHHRRTELSSLRFFLLFHKRMRSTLTRAYFCGEEIFFPNPATCRIVVDREKVYFALFFYPNPERKHSKSATRLNIVGG